MKCYLCDAEIKDAGHSLWMDGVKLFYHPECCPHRLGIYGCDRGNVRRRMYKILEDSISSSARRNA